MAEGAERRTRGRPPTSPSRAGDSLTLTPRLRCAWLLRVCRLNGQRRWRNQTAFAQALSALRLQGVHPATVSRWERGLSAVPYDAVRGYELLLERPNGSLTSVFDTVLRYYAPVSRTALPLSRLRPDERAAWQRTEELLRRAAGGEVLDGDAWDELTALTFSAPRFSYGTGDLWQSAARRLLGEVLITDGVNWMQRFEAFNRMLAHPVLGAEAVEVLRAVVADRSVQSLIGTVCMYDGSERSDAGLQVMRHLRSPADDRVFKGALMACVRKIHYGHFNGAQLTALSGTLAGVLTDSGADLDAETRELVVSVLRQIPEPRRHRHAVHVLTQEQRDKKLPAFRPAARDHARTVSQRLAHEACARMDTPPDGFHDLILPALIEEALFHPVFDVRLYAATLIHASPYRAPVAGTLLKELSATWLRGDELWVTTLLQALRKLGGPTERSAVEALVVDPRASTTITDVAAHALGHIGGTSPPAFWTRALGHHRTAWRRGGRPGHASVLDRLVYAIGRAGESGVLHTVRKDTAMPPAVRVSARWWLGTPRT
mgnify:CR=1 FL=1